MRRSDSHHRKSRAGGLAFTFIGLLASAAVSLAAQTASGQNREALRRELRERPGGLAGQPVRAAADPRRRGLLLQPLVSRQPSRPPGSRLYPHAHVSLYARRTWSAPTGKGHLQGNRFIEQNKSTDLTNARLSVRLRGDIDLQGANLVLLIQGKTPKTMANFVLSGQPLRVEREWTEQTIVLSPDPKQWTCLGARWDKVDQYGCDDIAVLLKDVNFDIMFVLFPLKVVPTHPELVKDMHRMRPGQDYPGYPSYEVEQKYLPRGVIMFDSVRIDYPAAEAQANPAGDATLRALATSPGKLSPGFSSPRTLYTVFVSQSCESIRVTAAADDPRAVIEVNGARIADGGQSAPIPVGVGRNLVDVGVTSADGKSRENYRIRVMRPYPTPNWVRVKDANPWVPRDSMGELVFNNRMWIFGGYTPGLVNDVWSSADGVEWTKNGEIPCAAGINVPVNFVFGGKMWVSGNDGSFYSSSDGAHWDLVLAETPWKGAAGSGVIFNGKMWVIARNRGSAPGDSVWSSADGVEWRLETAATPFSKRQLFSALVAHRDRMYAVGGAIQGYHPFRAYNDVWSSADGKSWTKLTDQAPWPPRIWNTARVYKNRIWMMGGFRAEPTWNNFNDVWYSADGAAWDQLATEDIWSPRHEYSLYVFDDKLWMVGGNAWPLQNDVWYLEIRGLTFLSQPVIEEVAGNEYTYRAKADFNASGEKLSYRLVEAPGWLKVDPATGVIRGTPLEPGDHRVTVEAADAAGESARQTYTLYIDKE